MPVFTRFSEPPQPGDGMPRQRPRRRRAGRAERTRESGRRRPPRLRPPRATLGQRFGRLRAGAAPSEDRPTRLRAWRTRHPRTARALRLDHHRPRRRPGPRGLADAGHPRRARGRPASPGSRRGDHRGRRPARAAPPAPAGRRRRCPASVLAALTVLNLLDMGFNEYLGRGFNAGAGLGAAGRRAVVHGGLAGRRGHRSSPSARCSSSCCSLFAVTGLADDPPRATSWPATGHRDPGRPDRRHRLDHLLRLRAADSPACRSPPTAPPAPSRSTPSGCWTRCGTRPRSRRTRRRTRFGDTPARANWCRTCAARTSSSRSSRATAAARSRTRSWPPASTDTLDASTEALDEGRVPRQERLADLGDVRRQQLARPLHHPVGSVDRQPAALPHGHGQRPPQPHQGLPEDRRLGHGRRDAGRAEGLAGAEVLRPGQGLQRLRTRLQGAEVQLVDHARPVRAGGVPAAGARQEARQAADVGDHPDLQPPALGADPEDGRLGRARRRLGLRARIQTAGTKPSDVIADTTKSRRSTASRSSTR